jgi:Flp pilus assembly protein TadB
MSLRSLVRVLFRVLVGVSLVAVFIALPWMVDKVWPAMLVVGVLVLIYFTISIHKQKEDQS